VKVRTLSTGAHFGELALINKQLRSLSIRVSSDDGCKLHTLDKDTFTRILGSIDQYLKKDYDKAFDDKFKKLQGSQQPQVQDPSKVGNSGQVNVVSIDQIQEMKRSPSTSSIKQVIDRN